MRTSASLVVLIALAYLADTFRRRSGQRSGEPALLAHRRRHAAPIDHGTKNRELSHTRLKLVPCEMTSVHVPAARHTLIAVLLVIGSGGVNGQTVDGRRDRATARTADAGMTVAAPAREDDLAPALKSLRFLLGDWAAMPGSAGETGASSFRSSVQGRVIVRTNYANYPAANGKPALRHDDLMVIAVDGGALRADYFDNEGHVIRYMVESPASGQVTFVSDVKPNEPRYRLRYAANADGTLSGAFDVAPPGKPDSFNPYLKWSARRTR